MTLEIGLTLLITALAIVMFATEKVRMDAVAILLIVSLAATGLIDSKEALSGFSNSSTITVAAMFILAAGLQHSGALNRIGQMLGRVKSPLMFLAVMFVSATVMSMFISNTAVVAVFIPIVLASAHKIGMAPSKALIPLSLVAQMAGLTTLIGTSSNLLVNGIAEQQGAADFGVFDFTLFGLLLLAAGCVYLLLAYRFLPDTHMQENDSRSNGHYVAEFQVKQDSLLIGQTISDSAMRKEFHAFPLALIRRGEKLSLPAHQTVQADDVLLIRAEPENLLGLQQQFGLELHDNQDNSHQEEQDWVVVEAMIAPGSDWAQERLDTLQDDGWSRSVQVIGVQRRGNIVRKQLGRLKFKVGDILLLLVPRKDIDDFRRDSAFIVLAEGEKPMPNNWRAPFSIFVMLAVVTVAAFEWAHISMTSMMGAVAMVTAGCLSAEAAYKAINWRIIILLAGLLPLGLAMTETGAAQYVVDHTVGLVKDSGPLLALGALYLVTKLLTEFMSNSGVAVLFAPIAISTAKMLGVNPEPFLIAVMFAAGASLMTPVGYQTNTMVYGAGGYRFSDFVKIGLPLNVILMALTLLLIPMFWSFEG